MELGTKVVVKQKVKVHEQPLGGMYGRVVDRPGPNGQIPENLHFVRFPADGPAEFFAWIKAEHLDPR